MPRSNDRVMLFWRWAVADGGAPAAVGGCMESGSSILAQQGEDRISRAVRNHQAAAIGSLRIAKRRVAAETEIGQINHIALHEVLDCRAIQIGRCILDGIFGRSAENKRIGAATAHEGHVVAVSGNDRIGSGAPLDGQIVFIVEGQVGRRVEFNDTQAAIPLVHHRCAAAGNLQRIDATAPINKGSGISGAGNDAVIAPTRIYRLAGSAQRDGVITVAAIDDHVGCVVGGKEITSLVFGPIFQIDCSDAGEVGPHDHAAAAGDIKDVLA